MNRHLDPARTIASPTHLYLPFVDGLRAISVIAVVFYHIGLTGFGGGFVGVDIFFVISGYLIINHISKEMKAGTFSLLDFYARRALRILPPFFIVLLFSIILASFILVTPPEIRDFGEAVVWSSLMAVNHYFLEQQGYFDTNADLKPLLNLWSLAVEEQFYLGVPIILLGMQVLRWRGGAGVYWLIGLFAVLSFAGCVYYSDGEKNYAFYLTPLRAWQFVAGGAIGLLLPVLGRLSPRLATGLAYAGLLSIGGAIAFLDEKLVYPSWYAAIPVLGAVMVIAAGLANPGSAPIRLLGSRPAVAIGLVSYSWYLWHWPLLSFARLWNFNQTTLLFDFLVGTLAILPAIATYFLVEKPIKERRRFLPEGWRAYAVSGGVATALIFAGSAWVVAPAQANAARASMDRKIWPKPNRRSAREREDPCFVRRNGNLAEECAPLLEGKPVGLLAGDSHSEVYYDMLRRRTVDNQLGLITQYANGCRPFLFEGGSRRCRGFFDDSNEAVFTSERKLDFAILSGAWNRAMFGIGWQSDRSAVDIQERAAALTANLAATLDELRRRGVPRILILGPVPELAFDAPTCLVRADRFGLSREKCAVPRSIVEARSDPVKQAIRAAVEDRRDVRFIDPIDVFCDASLCRPYTEDGTLYNDDHHISRQGAELVYKAFRRDFRWVLLRRR